MPFDAERETQLSAQKIKEIQSKEHLPGPMIDFLSQVHEACTQARPTTVITLPVAEDLAGANLRAQGAPLWNRDQFPFDRDQAGTLFDKLLDLTLTQDGPLGAAAQSLSAARDDDKLDLDKAFAAHVADDRDFFATWAEAMPEAPHTCSFLVQNALAPSLAEAGVGLAAQLGEPGVWAHGHCPVCGSLPFMGELREKQGYRHLHCSFCRTDYRAARIQCPYCGEDDTEKLSFFQAEEEPGFRVDACKTCGMYIKTIDFRERTWKAHPLWDDLSSMALDILAAREGYKRPTLSAWGF